MKIILIVAADRADCIGRGGTMPWHISGDLKHFSSLTRGQICICGAKNHQAIVEQIGGPLLGRTTVVVSRQGGTDSELVRYASGPDRALMIAMTLAIEAGLDRVMVIGGAQIYEALLPNVNTVYLTRVDTEVNGETFMPNGWLEGFELTDNEWQVQGPNDDFRYSFATYERR